MAARRADPRGYYAQRRALRAKYMPQGACAKCGATTNLTWDHVDPATKTRKISEMLHSYSEQRIEEELAKCQVLCASCNTSKGGVTPRKLNDRDKAEIRRRCRGGELQRVVAADYGVTQSHVSRLLSA